MNPRAIIRGFHKDDAFYGKEDLIGRKCMPLRNDQILNEGYFTGPIKYFSIPKGNSDKESFFYGAKLEFYKGSLEEVPCN